MRKQYNVVSVRAKAMIQQAVILERLALQADLCLCKQCLLCVTFILTEGHIQCS